MRKWNLQTTDANLELMSKTLGISPIVARVLANRGVRTKNTAIAFLQPQKKFLHNPSTLKDIQKAADLLQKHIKQHTKIAVYGDYDVDGVTSTVILCKTIAHFGGNVMHYIPHREHEGYGLNQTAVEKLCKMGVSLIITCDNGIASHAEIELATKLGMEVIVIDHHEPAFVEENGIRKDLLPKANAIINPKQADCPYPFKLLCAAAVSFKFSQFCHTYFQIPFVLEDELLIFATIATFCDVVDLVMENRILAKLGLLLINNGAVQNMGLQKLIEKRQLQDKTIGSFEMGFLLGPCINATGRLESATLSVDLFLSEDTKTVETLSQKLLDLNDDRKAITNQALEKTLNFLATSNEPMDKVLCIFDPTVHESVMGIVAGRIKEATNHPTILFTQSEGCIKGSARSIECFNMFEALYPHKDLFLRFGGHAMAAGLSLPEENLPKLRQLLNQNCNLTEDDFQKQLTIDQELEPTDVTFELAQQLQTLEPFGKGNSEPIFVSRGVFTETIETIGESKKTMRFVFPVARGRKLKAICFNKREMFEEALQKKLQENKISEVVCKGILEGRIKQITLKMDIAYTIEINSYMGNNYLQLRLLDFSL